MKKKTTLQLLADWFAESGDSRTEKFDVKSSKRIMIIRRIDKSTKKLTPNKP